MYCKKCGAILNDNAVTCSNCGADVQENILQDQAETITEQQVNTDTITPTTSTAAGICKVKAKTNPIFIILMLLIIVGLVALAYDAFRTPVYEYTVKTYYGDSNDRMGSFSAASAYSTININEAELNSLGEEGWEIVNSYLEMETAWPNFGNEEYVSGLQPNVRPQKLVVVLKREVKPFSSDAE